MTSALLLGIDRRRGLFGAVGFALQLGCIAFRGALLGCRLLALRLGPLFGGEPLALGRGLLRLGSSGGPSLLFGAFPLGLLFRLDLRRLQFGLVALGFGLGPLGLDPGLGLRALGLGGLLGGLRLHVGLDLLDLALAMQLVAAQRRSYRLLRASDHFAQGPSGHLLLLAQAVLLPALVSLPPRLPREVKPNRTGVTLLLAG